MDFDPERAMRAIASIESAGSGDYSALGPVTKKGDRAFGRYQVMGANIPSWTQAALGRQMTPQEFLANPEAQDAVFKHQFGQNVQKYGNVNDAASVWFTGKPQSQGGVLSDQLGTTGNQYVAKFAQAYGGAPAGQGVLSQVAQQPQPDLPAEGAQDAQGIMSQAQGYQPYQPTMTDSLDKLSAAFFMRDSPQQAQILTNDIAKRAALQAQALRRAQATQERWQTGQPYQQANGKWVVPQTSTNGNRRVVPMTPGEEPAQDPDVPTRQEVVATGRRDQAMTAINQIETVQGHIDTLREALQHGTFKVGPDQTGKMVLQNITGNSDESSRYLKAMESSIIAAATAVAQQQKGALTNFKFQKDMEQVMPSFAANDKKAAYESLKRVSEGLQDNWRSAANGIVTAGRQFPRLGKMMDPVTGDDIDVAEHYKELAKRRHERQQKMYEAEPAFMASPGRGAAPTRNAPPVGFKKNGYVFQGGDPADRASWTKE